MHRSVLRRYLSAVLIALPLQRIADHSASTLVSLKVFAIQALLEHTAPALPAGMQI